MGFTHPRVGVCGLQILDKMNRDVKEKEQKCRKELGERASEY